MTDLFHSQLLIDSLAKSPLLVDQLGDYSHFDRSFLNIGELETSLNFSQKLGHLYEDALEQVLRSSPRVTDLHCSVQVFEGKRTVGEFDYLFHLDDELIHLELAVKFYCAVHIDGQLRWYGPDARDHWDRKRERMISHQLELAQKEGGKGTIENLCGSSEAQTRHLIYGRLFDHLNTELEIATDVSENASRGKWLWRSELVASVTSENLWLVPKCLWPCEVSESLLSALERKTLEELLSLSEERAMMFTDGREFYFIVHDTWLDGAE